MAISAKFNIPDLPPFKLITVLRHYTYLWPYTMRVRYGRITRARDSQSAGKILGGGATGLVVWRDEFIAKYPELRGYNVYREEVESGDAAKSARYELVFKPREGEAEINSFQVQQYYQAGATFTLDQIIHGSPLLSSLNQVFAPSFKGDKLLSLAYYSLLTGSLAYNDFLFFQADTRLPYPDALTERDINNLLSEISDVELSHFFEELKSRSAKRLTRKSRLYALQVNLPHNLLMQLSQGKVRLYTNQEDLDQVIGRDVHEHAWRNSATQAQLARFNQSQDDQALVLLNGSTGQTYGFHQFNSADFSERELAEFLHTSSRPERSNRAPTLTPEQSEFAQALKNTKELEQKTGYVDLSKPNRQVRLKTINNAINLVGALSPTGSEARALSDLGQLSHNDPTSRRSSMLGATDVGTALATLEENRANGLTINPQTGMVPRGSLLRQPSHDKTVPPLLKQAVPELITLVRTAPQDLVASLRHYNQLSQPVLFDVPLTHNVARYIKKHCLEQLLDLGHYDHEKQRFSLTIRLPHRFPEYDLSTKGDIFSKDPLALKSLVRPKQLNYELVVHVVFDLEPLITESAHTKERRQEAEEELSQEEEGFEETVFEHETKQGTVRLSARQAKKLASIDNIDPDELLEELPQASFWQGQDSIKTHTHAPLRELTQDDLDLIDDVAEALGRLGEENVATNRSTAMGSSVVNAWRKSTTPNQPSSEKSIKPSAETDIVLPQKQRSATPNTRFNQPGKVKPLEGQTVAQPEKAKARKKNEIAAKVAATAKNIPMRNPFLAQEAAKLQVGGTRSLTPNKGSDAERLALLMQSMAGLNTSLENEPSPNADPSAWLPQHGSTKPSPTQSLAIEQIDAAPIVLETDEAKVQAEIPAAAPKEESPKLAQESEDFFADPETERKAEAMAAAMLDDADYIFNAEQAKAASQDKTTTTPKRAMASDDFDFWEIKEPHNARSFFDFEDDFALPEEQPVKQEEPDELDELDELIKARRKAKRQEPDNFFDLEEEEQEEVDGPNQHHNEDEAAWDRAKLQHEDLARLLNSSLELAGAPNFSMPQAEYQALEVPSEQLTSNDAPLIRQKPKALGALATLAAAAQERRTRRAERALTAGQKKRLSRDLLELIDYDLTASLGCLKIMISNQITDVNEAYSTVKSLDLATEYLDLMCYDVYKVERALLNPMALELRPRLKQLLRGKSFMLFYALSLHLMLKSLLERKDTEVGGRTLRQQMGLYNVADLLTKLNHISAARRDEGLFYPSNLKMQYRSLFEFAGVNVPSFEAYDDGGNELAVHLRRSNSAI